MMGQSHPATHGSRSPTDERDPGSLRDLSLESIPDLLRQRARHNGDEVALRVKKGGIYRETTWGELYEEAGAFGAGLARLGLGPGDRVAIMGDPSPQWLCADFGVQLAGGISVGIYPTSSPKEVAHIMNDSGARFFVAQDQEHLDKVLQLAEDTPTLERIIVIDTQALFMYQLDRVVSYAEMVDLGRAAGGPDCPAVRDTSVNPTTPSVLVYTSGTTGDPKGVVLTNRNLVAGALAFLLIYRELSQGEYRSVCHLPLAHILERTLTGVIPLLGKVVPHFGEDPEAVAQTFWEVSPTFFMTVPRYWEKLASNVVIRVRSSSWFKRKAYEWAMAVGRRRLDFLLAGGKVPSWTALRYALARLLVFRPLLDQVGLRHVRLALTGGAAIPQAVKSLWQTWGIDIHEVYGQTESVGPITASTAAFRPAGGVGQPVPDDRWEVLLAEDGEVLARSPMVSPGYWGDLTGATLVDPDGWLHTGDIGEFTLDGELKLVDRKKDIIVTSGGKTLSPAQIENTLRGSPFIAEAMVFGHERRFLTALIEIDLDAVLEWARQESIPYSSFTALTQEPGVVSLVESEIREANSSLSRVEQVKKFRIIPKELDPEEGETTPTRKVKRQHSYEQFRELVESMYEHADDDLLEQEVNR